MSHIKISIIYHNVIFTRADSCGVLNARIAAQFSRNGSRSPFGASRFLTRPGDGRLVGFVGQDVDYTVKQADEILDST